MDFDSHERSLPAGPLVTEGRSICDGKLYKPREVPLGKACCCVCPVCGEPLIAKHCLDSDIAPHFAHEPGADCARGFETWLHRTAKQLIEAERKLFLPTLLATVRVGHHAPSALVVGRDVYSLADVALEQRVWEISARTWSWGARLSAKCWWK